MFVNADDRLNDLDRRITVLENGSRTDDKVHWAWRLHRNADSLQHQRHSMFILGQSIFFAAFGTNIETPGAFRHVVAALGVSWAILWIVVAFSLERRLDAMRKILREHNNTWNEYEASVAIKHLGGGRIVLGVILPLLVVAAWVFLVADPWLWATPTQ